MSDGTRDLPPTGGRKFGELRRLPALSVVVTAGGEPEPLRRCLAALLRQDFEAGRYEIITVDPDDLPAIREVVSHAAAEAAGLPPVQYLVADGHEGLAAARNRGWMYSRGAVVAFLDADEVPAANWLRLGLAALAPGVDVIRGRVRVELPDRPNDHQREVAALAEKGLVGSNSFVRRVALAAIGGFDERFSAAWNSDADLQFMLIEHFRDRQRVQPEPLAEVLWQPHPTGWDASLRRQRWRQFDVLLNAKHPALYRERFGGLSHDLLHVAHLCIVGLLTVGAAALLTANFMAAAITLALWTVLTGVLCVHRLNGSRSRLADIVGAVSNSIALPLLAVFWRLIGTLRFRAMPMLVRY